MRIKKITNVPLMLVCILIFLAFLTPRNISIVKLCFIVLALVIYYMGRPLRINMRLTSMRFLCLYLMYALWSTGNGFLRGNPDTYQLFQLNVIYFLMLYAWIMIVENQNHFMAVLRTCCIVSIGISVYTLLFFAQTVHLINLPFFIYLDHASGAMIHSGYVHITNMNMSMMLFLFPVILFIYNTPETKSDPSLNKLDRWAIILSVIAMMLSGRRIVWLVLFGTIACYVLFKMERSAAKRVGKVVIALLGTVVVFYILSRLFGINIDGFIDRFQEAFRDVDNYGRVNVRWIQLEALWKGFLRNPILGSGAGIGVTEIIRSTEHSSSYEMSYALILYNAGIIGFIPYVLSLALVVRKLWRYGKNDGIAKALFFGTLFGLIANATNPYFSSSFDFLLWIFIPLMYLNVIETDEYYYTRNTLNGQTT